MDLRLSSGEGGELPRLRLSSDDFALLLKERSLKRLLALGKTYSVRIEIELEPDVESEPVPESGSEPGPGSCSGLGPRRSHSLGATVHLSTQEKTAGVILSYHLRIDSKDLNRLQRPENRKNGICFEGIQIQIDTKRHPSVEA